MCDSSSNDIFNISLDSQSQLRTKPSILYIYTVSYTDKIFLSENLDQVLIYKNMWCAMMLVYFPMHIKGSTIYLIYN